MRVRQAKPRSKPRQNSAPTFYLLTFQLLRARQRERNWAVCWAGRLASIAATRANLKRGWIFVCCRREVLRRRCSRPPQRVKTARTQACARRSKEKPGPSLLRCRGCEREQRKICGAGGRRFGLASGDG